MTALLTQNNSSLKRRRTAISMGLGKLVVLAFVSICMLAGVAESNFANLEDLKQNVSALEATEMLTGFVTNVANNANSNKTTNVQASGNNTEGSSAVVFQPINNGNIHHAVKEWMKDKHAAKLQFGPIWKWNVSHVTDMSYLFSTERFKEFGHFTDDVSAWDVSRVHNMSHLFYGNAGLDMNFQKWNVSKVVDMSGMFSTTKSLTGLGLEKWSTKTGHVQNMSSMFHMAVSFNNTAINKWDTSSVRDMSKMMYATKSFKGNKHFKWRTGRVHDMSEMFAHAILFVGDVSDFDTSSVKSMDSMFLKASAFNGGLSKWDTHKVTSMSRMFSYAGAFKGTGISSWNVSRVHDMESMFMRAEKLNVNLTSWEVSSVTDMSQMFKYSKSFAQKLCWTLHSKAKVDGIFFHSQAHFSKKCVNKEVIAASCCPIEIDSACGCSSEGQSAGHSVEVINAPNVEEKTSSNGMGEGQSSNPNANSDPDTSSSAPNKSMFNDSTQYLLALGLAMCAVSGAAMFYYIRRWRGRSNTTTTIGYDDDDNMMMEKNDSDFDKTMSSTTSPGGSSESFGANMMIPDDDSVIDDMVDVEDIGGPTYPSAEFA